LAAVGSLVDGHPRPVLHALKESKRVCWKNEGKQVHRKAYLNR